MIPRKNQARLIRKDILGLEPLKYEENDKVSSFRIHCFASISMKDKNRVSEFTPTPVQLMKHPLAIVALVPKKAAVFAAGAVVGAAAKTVTAPLDRIKLIMQTHGLRAGQETAKKTIGFIETGGSGVIYCHSAKIGTSAPHMIYHIAYNFSMRREWFAMRDREDRGSVMGCRICPNTSAC